VPSLIDYCAGAQNARYVARLSTTRIVEPPSLQNLVEATFPGYCPTEFVPTSQTGSALGYAEMQGWCEFVLLWPVREMTATCLWITGTIGRGEDLIAVLKFDANGGELLFVGPNRFTLNISAYAQAA